MVVLVVLVIIDLLKNELEPVFLFDMLLFVNIFDEYESEAKFELKSFILKLN